MLDGDGELEQRGLSAAGRLELGPRRPSSADRLLLLTLRSSFAADDGVLSSAVVVRGEIWRWIETCDGEDEQAVRDDSGIERQAASGERIAKTDRDKLSDLGKTAERGSVEKLGSCPPFPDIERRWMI